MALFSVVFALAVLCVMGFSTHYQVTSTARLCGRVISEYTLVSAGESALIEAMVYVRRSLDTSAVTTDCPDDWRALVLDSLETRTKPSSRRVTPALSRRTFRQNVGPIEISDVTIRIVRLFRPDPPKVGEPFIQAFPHCVLEMSVSVVGGLRPYRIEKTIRERRGVSVNTVPFEMSTALARSMAVFTLLPTPLGEVVR